MVLEACVGNLKDALSAQHKGAHQIELCDRLDLDGISPSLQLVAEVSSALDIPVKVIINPKPFDYKYNPTELRAIVEYVKAISNYDIAGIVFGALDEKRMPDLFALKLLSEHTDLPITFHKAIDLCGNIPNAIRSLIDQNIVRYILSSGGQKTAIQGIDMIMKMDEIIQKAHSDLQIICAGRVNKENLPALHKKLSLRYYHGKLIVGPL